MVVLLSVLLTSMHSSLLCKVCSRHDILCIHGGVDQHGSVIRKLPDLGQNPLLSFVNSEIILLTISCIQYVNLTHDKGII